MHLRLSSLPFVPVITSVVSSHTFLSNTKKTDMKYYCEVTRESVLIFKEKRLYRNE